MTIPASAWIVEPPAPLFAVSVETYRAHGVERTHYAIYATQTGETIAETPHPWAASLIAQALNTTAQAFTPTPDEDQYIGTPEAAALEGVTSETIRRWCETGELAGSKTAPGRSSRWKTTRRFLRERRERLERMKA